MFITITIETDGNRADIRIDSEQKISEGLKVLRDSGKLPYGHNPNFFRSCIKECIVSAYKTFREEDIFDGDVLIEID
jgi:hypothetical protein